MTDQSQSNDPKTADAQSMASEAIETVSHLGLAASLAMAMGFVIRLILPRILGRDQLGVLYFADSFSAMFFTVLPLGVTAFIVREIPIDKRQIGRILPTLLPAAAIWGLVVWTIMMGALWLTGADEMTLYCGGAMGVFNACMVLQRSILRRSYVAHGESARMARLEVAIRVLLVFFVLLCVWLRVSVIAVAMAYASSEAIGVLLLVTDARRKGHLSEPFDGSMLRSIVRQTMPFFAVGALVEIYGNINTTILNFFAGKSEVAYFGAADKLKGMGLMLVPVMQAALQPVLAKAWHRDQQQFRTLLTQTVKMLCVLSLPMTLGLMVLSDFLSKFIFGEQFSDGYRAISYLAPVLTLTYLNVLMGSCLNIVSDGRQFFRVTAISLILNISLNLVLIPLSSQYWGAGGAAAGSALATVVSEFYVMAAVRKIFPIDIEVSAIRRMLLITSMPCALAGLMFEQLCAIAIGWRILIILIIPGYLFMTGMFSLHDISTIRRIKSGSQSS